MILIGLKPRFLVHQLKKIVFPHSDSLLDVGCGENSVTQFIKAKLKETTGFDLYAKAIEKSKRKDIHDEYVQGDVANLDRYFKPQSFDCVLSIDVLEHLEKKVALTVIKKMEKVARKYVVLQTTNGFLPQDEVAGNPYQVHKCGFDANELRRLGYKVLGMDGPKVFRGYCAEIKLKPKWLFVIIANILDPLFRYYPELCFNLLAFKEMGK